jgi:hypothetical protein
MHKSLCTLGLRLRGDPVFEKSQIVGYTHRRPTRRQYAVDEISRRRVVAAAAPQGLWRLGSDAVGGLHTPDEAGTGGARPPTSLRQAVLRGGDRRLVSRLGRQDGEAAVHDEVLAVDPAGRGGGQEGYGGGDVLGRADAPAKAPVMPGPYICKIGRSAVNRARQPKIM